jgi:putative colanic acid biosynthesis acetyltransferase WcaF
MLDLSHFDNSWYHPGRSRAIQALWFFVGLPLLRSPWLPLSSVRASVLRLFGARVGKGAVIKPGVRVKYPWLLTVGDHVWIGEDAWIDNLAQVMIGNHVCISQGANLCTGNHDWSDPNFGLLIKPITLESGSWVGARAVIAPGVTLGQYAIATAGAVVYKSIPPNEIHSGNPATFQRYRVLSPVAVNRKESFSTSGSAL